MTAYLDPLKTHGCLLDKITSSSFAKMAFLSPVLSFYVLIYSFVVVSSTNISTNASGEDNGEMVIILVKLRMLMGSSSKQSPVS